MRTIKIFVAGAKKPFLEEERNAVDAVVNSINALNFNPDETDEEQITIQKIIDAQKPEDYTYWNPFKGIKIKTYSYETLGNNQETYDKFICEKADILFIILQREIGPKTQDELIKASCSYNKKYHPDISIFIQDYEAKKDKNGNEVIPCVAAKVQGLMSTCLKGNYYEKYNGCGFEKENTESNSLGLKKLIVNCLIRHITQTKERRRKKAKRIFSNIVSKVLSLLVGIAAIAGVYFYATRHQPTLVVSGGGSAKNYVDGILLKNGQEKIEKWNQTIYIPMPSTNAWQLLREEYLHKDENNQERKKFEDRKYFPTILSATEAHDTTFNHDFKDHYEAGAIVSIPIGKDPLAVILSDSAMMNDPSADSITVDELRDLIEKISKLDNNRIFATTSTSGTHMAHQKALQNGGFTLSKYANQPLDTTMNLNAHNGKPYIALGSEHYLPKHDKLPVKVIKKIIQDGKPVIKNMYLYFMAYVVNGDLINLRIPDCTLMLLDRTNLRKELEGYELNGILRRPLHKQTQGILSPNEFEPINQSAQ